MIYKNWLVSTFAVAWLRFTFLASRSFTFLAPPPSLYPSIFFRLFSLFPYLSGPILYEIENGAKQSNVCGRAVG